MNLQPLLAASFFAFSSLFGEEPPSAKPSPSEQETATARSRVLELAGAFTNDGFRTRDGFWAGVLEPEKPLFIEVNLFSGNEYWFSAAALPPSRKITLSLYDEKGRPLEGNLYEDSSTAAIGLKAPMSGRFFLRLEMIEGEKADFCLVYSYK